MPTRSTLQPSMVHWKKLGRISGYALDYGLGASGGPGVTDVYTNVDQYRTSDNAKQGLAAWKSIDPLVAGSLGESGGGGLAFAIRAQQVAPVGANRFAFLVSYSAANIAPVFGLDEQFTEGRYEADVTVWAGSAEAATTLAQSLAKKLYARVRLALEGRLHTKPVKLPPKPKPKPGPLPGGPDLIRLALQASDLGPYTRRIEGSYFVPFYDPTALSAYHVTACIGKEEFCEWFADQKIHLCPSANQASFMADFWAATTLARPGSSEIDLTGVGDGARGFFVDDGWGAVVLSSGPLTEFIDFGPNAQASDLQKLAQAAANYINAAGLAAHS